MQMQEIENTEHETPKSQDTDPLQIPPIPDLAIFPRRIALSGPMGAGKTGTARLLAERLGYKRLSFARAMKQDIADYFGIQVEILEDLRTKAKYRGLMQGFGQLARDFIDEDWWVRRWEMQNFETLANPNTRLVIDDMRYQNELELAERLGFVPVRLQPTMIRQWEYLTEVLKLPVPEALEQSLHKSETSLNLHPFTYVVDEAGPPEQSYQELRRQFIENPPENK